MAMLSLPVVLLRRASLPLAVLRDPLVLEKSANTPLAALSNPIVLDWSVEEPLAVLSKPLVLEKSARTPLAILAHPVVLEASARLPLAVLADPVVPGLESFGDSSLNIRLVVKTQPGVQWGLARALRKRIKERFDEEGIEIPFPQRVIHHVSSSDSKTSKENAE